MIELTKLNGEAFTFNAIYIEQLQSKPDTTITTTQGKKFIVRESEVEVVRRIKAFYKEVGMIAVSDKVGEDKE